MTIKVGINGFGRIGRLALRAAWDWTEMEFVQINDPAGDAATHAHLLNFDSVHGRWQHEAGSEGDCVVIDGKRIKVSANKAIADTDWSSCDLVLEASGKMKTVAVLQGYLDQGVERVVVCAPVKEQGALNVVMGVNQHLFDPAQHRIVTAASCTTNCLAPMAKVLDDTYGIKGGLMTTIHAYTNDQNTQDAPHPKGDLRRARAAAQNIVPNSTGAAKAIGLVLPNLKGKLDGSAQRVPTLTGSLTELTTILGQKVTVEEVNKAMKAASNESYGYTEDEIVSSDIIGSHYGSIFDSTQTRVMSVGDIQLVKTVSWYDNEMSYVSQLVRTVKYFAGLINKK